MSFYYYMNIKYEPRIGFSAHISFFIGRFNRFGKSIRLWYLLGESMDEMALDENGSMAL